MGQFKSSIGHVFPILFGVDSNLVWANSKVVLGQQLLHEVH